MEVAIRRDLRVLQQDLAALSDEVAKLGNLPDEQSIKESSSRIRRVRADLERWRPRWAARARDQSSKLQTK